jgi:hypothetical protein
MVDTFGRPVQGALERPATRIKALGYYLLPLRGKVGLAPRENRLLAVFQRAGGQG